MNLLALAYLVPSIILGSIASILLKKGAGKPFRKILSNYQLVLGLFLFGCSLLLYLPSLRYGELSIVYPLGSFSYVIIALLSQHYLKEKMTITKWLGIIFIICGSFLVIR